MNRYELIKDIVEHNDELAPLDLVIYQQEREDDDLSQHIMAFIEEEDLNNDPDTD